MGCSDALCEIFQRRLHFLLSISEDEGICFRSCLSECIFDVQFAVGSEKDRNQYFRMLHIGRINGAFLGTVCRVQCASFLGVFIEDLSKRGLMSLKQLFHGDFFPVDFDAFLLVGGAHKLQ